MKGALEDPKEATQEIPPWPHSQKLTLSLVTLATILHVHLSGVAIRNDPSVTESSVLDPGAGQKMRIRF